jgi:hypothetical protein
VGSSSEKTTMIILCDDGSLKIYVADSGKTEYWLQPHLKQTNPILQLKTHARGAAGNWSPAMHLFNLHPSTIQDIQTSRLRKLEQQQQLVKQSEAVASDAKKPELPANATTPAQRQKSTGEEEELGVPRLLQRKNAIKKKKSSTTVASNTKPVNTQTAQQPTSQPLFGIDFFEKCAQINDYELGGRDLLEVYNAQQLKSRLNLSNTRTVLSNKPDGFNIEITYNGASSTAAASTSSSNMLIVGVRVHLGTSSVERVPAFFEVLGRRVPVQKPVRPRWYDICLTRAESIVADNRLTLRVGPSQDARGSRVVSIDALLVYAKSRDELAYSRAESAQIQQDYAERQKRRLKSSANPGVDDNDATEAAAAAKKTALMKKTVKKKTPVTAVSTDIKNRKKLQSVSGVDKNQLQIYEPKLFDKLLGQSLHLAEHCLLLGSENSPSTDNEDSSEPHTVSTKLLSLVCPPLVLYKAKSLLLNSLALSSALFNNNNNNNNNNSMLTTILPLYNAYKDEALLTLVLRTFKLPNIPRSLITTVKINDYFDQVYDYEQLQRVLLVCGSLIHEQRAHNMARFAADNKLFVTALNTLFWRCVNRVDSSSSSSAPNTLSSIGQCQLVHLGACVETLVECMHALLLVEASTTNNTVQLAGYFGNLPLVNIIIACYMKLVCSTNLHINFTARKTLLNLLKHQHQQSSVTTATAQIVHHESASPAKKSIFTPATLNVTGSKSSAKSATTSKQQQQQQPKPQGASGTSSRAVDESVAFTGLSSSGASPENMDTENNENGQQDLVEPAQNEASAAAGVVAPPPPAAQQFMSLAPFSFNEEDEMLQLAMALSLNEANAAAAAAQQPPPPVLPRQTVSSSTSSSSPATKSTKLPSTSSSKSLTTSATTTKKETDLIAQQPQPPLVLPSYLLNVNGKLAVMRKVMLEKMAHCIEPAFFGRSFVLPFSGVDNNRILVAASSATAGLGSIAFFQCVLTLMADLNAKDSGDKLMLDTVLHGLLAMLQPLKDISNELKANKYLFSN